MHVSEKVNTIAYLSLGSNLGDRAASLNTAIEKLSSLGIVASVSDFYETEPMEVRDQPWFLNCAVKLMTEKTAAELLEGILQLESSMGRRRIQKKGPRTIDIDILLFGASIIQTESLTVPHPAMHERRFALEPLAEIAPDAMHPAMHRSVRNLLDSLPAGQQVRRIAR